MDSRYLYAGAPASVKVKLLREDGYKEPVRVDVKGLPPGVTADPLEISADKEEGDLVFHVPADAKPGTYGNLQVTAAGTSRPAWKSAPAAGADRDMRHVRRAVETLPAAGCSAPPCWSAAS